MTAEKRFDLALETFGYHLALAAGRMDIPGFIRRCAAFGLDGVQLNMGHLGPYLKATPEGARRVRELTASLGLFVEVDTRGTAPDHLAAMIELCSAVGADVLRTYASIDPPPRGTAGTVRDRSDAYAAHRARLAERLRDAPGHLRTVVPLCQRHGVRIAVENHEYETARDILDIVRAVGSPWVGTHIDTGNCMMVWEEPVAAVRAMAPYAVTTHFKDHVVVVVDGQPLVVGVTLGTGSADCAECFRILSCESPLQRLAIEVCYAYCAPFRCPPEDGGGARLGQGAFRIVEGPMEPSWIALYPERTRHLDPERLMAWQEDSVVQSVAYVQELNRRDGAAPTTPSAPTA